MEALAETIRYLSNNLTDLNTTQTGNLNTIDNALCRQEVEDCYYKGYKDHCNADLYRNGCDDCDSCNEECDSQECVGGEYHTCDNKPEPEEDWRTFKATCTVKKCTEDEDGNKTCVDKPCHTGVCEIETCTCACHPDQKTLINPIKTEIEYIRGVLKSYKDSLEALSEKVFQRAKDMKDSVDKVNAINKNRIPSFSYWLPGA
ncbi:MAG: hypothetical protein WAX07_04875 [Candidatus Altiarchaeia archaeon]